jgi:nicotinamide mononucleotide transporter
MFPQTNQIIIDFLVWFFNRYIEITATITGLIYLVYSIEGKIQLWFYGIITSFLYIIVFFTSGIYADMGINVYYVIISIYGWYHWKHPGKKDKEELPVSRLGSAMAFKIIIISVIIWILIALVLIFFTDSQIPWYDAFTTAFSITATWMLARKILEHWIIWVVVDLASLILYIYKGLYPTSVLFAFYTVLAIYGYYQWLKLWKTQKVRQGSS